MESSLYDRLLQEPDLMSAKKDLSKAERLLHFPPFAAEKHALGKVSRYEALIMKAAEDEQLAPSTVMAVLFREILSFGWEDLLDPFHADSSRGLGQIRASTARKADADLHRPLLPPEEYRRRLLEPEFNINYCARILHAEAKNMGADPASLSDGQLQKIYTIYNGSSVYGRNVQRYEKAIRHAMENKP